MTPIDPEAVSYSVFIASNRGGTTHRFAVRQSWIKAGAMLGFALFLLFSAVSIDYVGLRPKAREFETLWSENMALKQQTALREQRLSFINIELARVHHLTTKLKKIMQLNIGGVVAGKAQDPKVGIETVVEREPSSTGPMSAAPAPGLIDVIDSDAILNQAPSALPLPDRVEWTLQEARQREQELVTTWAAVSERQSLISAVPTIRPANGYYSSLFGYRYDPINGRPLLHAGLDIAAPWGTPVLAPADGVISHAGYEGGYGNLVVIDHGYGLTTRFGHNSRLFVHVGQHVRRWEVISAVGSTGHSTGAHVHYEVRLNGLPMDPQNYILQEN